MTYTLVVGAAPLAESEPFYRDLLAGAGAIVAADAAGEWCVALGRVPDVAIGDFDSASQGAVTRLSEAGVQVVRYPEEKDLTDLELAVAIARERYNDPIVLTAAFALRPDHTLAAFGALLRAGEGASVCEPGWTAETCVPGHPLALNMTVGATVSVLAVGTATGVTVEGVRWPLAGAHLDAMSGLGVSNRAVADTVRVSVEHGMLIVILPEVDT